MRIRPSKGSAPKPPINQGGASPLRLKTCGRNGLGGGFLHDGAEASGPARAGTVTVSARDNNRHARVVHLPHAHRKKSSEGKRPSRPHHFPVYNPVHG